MFNGSRIVVFDQNAGSDIALHHMRIFGRVPLSLLSLGEVPDAPAIVLQRALALPTGLLRSCAFCSHSTY